MKTQENDVKYSSFNMGEMDKSRELYSKEGDNSSRFEGKTVPWEHTMYTVYMARVNDAHHLCPGGGSNLGPPAPEASALPLSHRLTNCSMIRPVWVSETT